MTDNFEVFLRLFRNQGLFIWLKGFLKCKDKLFSESLNILKTKSGKLKNHR